MDNHSEQFQVEIYTQGNFSFEIAADQVVFWPIVKGRVTWEELEEAEELAEFLGMKVAGSA